MKISKNRWAQTGFTIIEVMIFLAVSGFMFILAAVFINGKQDEVVYKQSVQAAGATVTTVINGVANGEYPSLGNFSCSSGPSGQPSFSSTANGQGANGGCVFMGQVLQFGFDRNRDVSDPLSYSTYTVAGRQFAAGSTSLSPAQSFADAQPVAADNAQVNLTQTDALERGLAFSKAYLCSGDCTGTNQAQIGGVGFFGSFGSYSASAAGSQSSGAQTVSVVTLPSSGSDMADNINSKLKSAKHYDNINQAANHVDVLTSGNYVVLCFSLGNKPGGVQIGGQNGQQTAVSINFFKKTPC